MLYYIYNTVNSFWSSISFIFIGYIIFKKLSYLIIVSTRNRLTEACLDSLFSYPENLISEIPITEPNFMFFLLDFYQIQFLTSWWRAWWWRQRLQPCLPNLPTISFPFYQTPLQYLSYFIFLWYNCEKIKQCFAEPELFRGEF